MEFRTATELVAALHRREVSSGELTEQAIASIEAEDGNLNAVVVRDFERARAAAREADARLARGEAGALLGLPMTVKESFNVAGLPTTWGIPGTEGNVVTEDAVTVARLKRAGAVILGKTNASLGLADWQANNPVYGTTNNPWDPARTPGGSSGGAAAALAAGYVALELGSDLFGSLRVPAHFCGIHAHKPTLDLIPRRGHNPPGVPMLSVAPRIDLPVVGPMARSAGDLMLALDVLAGPDEAEATAYRLHLPPPRHTVLRDYRVLVLDQPPLAPVETEIGDALDALAGRLAKAGCHIGHSSTALPDLAAISTTYMRLLMAYMGTTMPEADHAAARARADGIPADASDPRSLAIRSRVASHRDWVRLDAMRAALAHQWRQFFRDWDIVLCPVLPVTAFPHDRRPWDERPVIVNGEPLPYGAQFIWPGIATLCGLPATALPAGLSPEGLPIGMQAVGPYLEDRTPIAFAALVDRAFGGFVPPPHYAAGKTRIPA